MSGDKDQDTNPLHEDILRIVEGIAKTLAQEQHKREIAERQRVDDGKIPLPRG